MYYSAGNYEAFARPEKPAGVDRKSAYIIGTGLAGLSAAFYLLRDGQMKGEHIHLLEKLELAGGSCDGRKDVTKGFYMRGGREMDNHFECMWDLYRSVPSIENPGLSVLDEYYYLNKKDPNYSLCRATVNCGEDAHTDKLFNLDKDSALALSKLFITPEKDLEDKKINEVLPASFFETNFWLYWQTMFAFQPWASALEMKRYLCRYVHHIDGLPDFTALRFTKYNQYESMILPLVKYLEQGGVKIEYGFDVKNVIIDNIDGKRVAKKIIYIKDGKESSIDLCEDDLVFITNGCCTDTSCYGDQDHAPDLSHIKNGSGESWDMWKNIASQATNGEYGNPDAFCSDINATNWMSATVATSDEEIIDKIMNICKRDPRSGKVTTGGIVTVKDSTKNWYLSWTINRQPQFKSQDKNTVLIWLYSLNTNKEGNWIKKPMRECSGKEVCEEWLYHIGLDQSKIEAKAANACNTTTCYMPYINAFFQPRKESDRPKVVVDNAVNFAFIGQFAETPRDTIFTTEYSIRTGMEAAYTLLNVDRGVPEVWGSKYDIRELLRACYYSVDKKSVDELPLDFKEKILLKNVLKAIKGSDLELLLKESGLIK
ncbi:oleate hydratase [Spirochaetales bacterium NM-380-WT-3C1]|uniref:Oleate hydratase n=1 Tax=Bullifex porci TaxID=2606638 RepID=A0A7X2TRZ9_9SPIO|nr:oleate hydratase [Bullifex porci]MSU06650.1 oleate hydratase [Bullifex porci]